jgi:hypothetical protein
VQESDLADRIHKRLEHPKQYAENGIEPLIKAILSVLAKHPHFHATDGSSRHVDTLGWPYDFGCGKCHASMRGSRDLNGLGWCETVTDIARALGIEIDDAVSDSAGDRREARDRTLMSVFWKCFYLTEDAFVAGVTLRAMAWAACGMWRDRKRRSRG